MRDITFQRLASDPSFGFISGATGYLDSQHIIGNTASSFTTATASKFTGPNSYDSIGQTETGHLSELNSRTFKPVAKCYTSMHEITNSNPSGFRSLFESVSNSIKNAVRDMSHAIFTKQFNFNSNTSFEGDEGEKAEEGESQSAETEGALEGTSEAAGKGSGELEASGTPDEGGKEVGESQTNGATQGADSEPSGSEPAGHGAATGEGINF